MPCPKSGLNAVFSTQQEPTDRKNSCSNPPAPTKK
nr:MAG TPA: hypothetical protein [Caudoviricetes sp.]